MKSIFLLFLFGISSISIVKAQGCHGGGSSSHDMDMHSSKNNTATHGGTIQEAGKYLIETVYDPLQMQDPICFYVMNANGKIIDTRNITGNSIITYQDSSSDTIKLEARGHDGFSIQLKDKTKPFTVFTTFKINGKTVSNYFQSAGISSQIKKGKIIYSCPMHPEIRSESPGQCPKCGMDLSIKKQD